LNDIADTLKSVGDCICGSAAKDFPSFGITPRYLFKRTKGNQNEQRDNNQWSYNQSARATGWIQKHLRKGSEIAQRIT
jgi:hypothetical protein